MSDYKYSYMVDSYLMVPNTVSNTVHDTSTKEVPLNTEHKLKTFD